MPNPSQPVDPIQALLDQYKQAYGFQTNGVGGPLGAPPGASGTAPAPPKAAKPPKPSPTPITPKPAAPQVAQNPAFSGTNIDPELVQQLLRNPQILQLLTGQVPQK